MLTIGVTGGIGSGKSTVTALFEKRGITVVDADQLSREVVQPGQEALASIANHFGNQLLDEHGGLNRQILREIIFSQPLEKKWLEALLHPLIAKLLKDRLAQCQSQYCMLASPLLLETQQHQLVDRILVIDITPQLQLSRTLTRDKSSKEETIKAIISAQISREQRLEKADDIIDNHKDLANILPQVEALHEKYCRLSRAEE
ncbi:MAG: dephospho-CoA kinase [SAR86 cluster bacterium]|uniref:Dephospho-CoA kinase n=1 Tax=SAR86 cluster bacterium TaxID=2030880 RepID=A0A2A4MI00_9GAMM|nr:MAG: dephospho-CoA kinase [SAR86 cluster bacterium]